MSDKRQDLTHSLSLAEVCAVAGISRALLYKLLKEGAGPHSFKIGRQRLFSVSAVQVWLAGLEGRDA